ncbi:MAG: HlyD family efflux transporter periplasmic adaptor subunit [Gammaproteobacteria bacterium]|nr:HlyD family efflux transporter periplasmic adaptor subunit [Gammaproteobacteria bacterium]
MKWLKDLLQRTKPTSQSGKRVAAASSMLAVAALLSLSIFATGPTSEPEQPKEKTWPVSVTAISPDAISPMFSTYGRVESSNVARLSVDVVATVRAVHVREGQWVEHNQLLIELDDRELALLVAEVRAELAQAQAQLKSIETRFQMVAGTTGHYENMQRISQTKLKRHEELYGQRMISQALFDEALQLASQQTINYQAHMQSLADFPNRIAEQKARVAKIEAAVGQADIDLHKAQLRAPFAGPVLSVTAARGITTQSGGPLVTIADSANFEIRTQIPDIYSGRLRGYLANGTPVAAFTEVSGQMLALPLHRLASNVRQGQSGLDAFFEIPQGVPAEIGRVVDLAVRLPPEARLVALPVQAIYESDRVYRVVDNRLQSMTVERIGEYTTERGEYRVLVRSAEFVAGQSIVTTQLPNAITGLRVEPL